jgi:hypothetical protein
MRMSMCTRLFPAMTLALTMAACAGDGVEDPPGGEPEPPGEDMEEPGEEPALATIRGVIQNEASDPPAGAQLVLRWHHENEDDLDEPVYESVEVSGDFPADFTLELFEAPPDRTWGRLDGIDDNPSDHRVAQAALELYPEDATEYERANALSWEEWHFVQYAPEAVPGDEVELGVDIPQGFSLIEHTADGPVISPIDTSLEIRLVDDTGVLHDPFDDV